MKPIAIALVNLKRMLRERSNIFFVFIFPIGIVLLVGIQFGGGFQPVVGVTTGDDGALSSAIVDALEGEGTLDVRLMESDDVVLSGVEHGSLQAGLFLPAGMDATIEELEVVDIEYLSRPDGSGAQVQSVVSAVIADVMAPVGAAQYAARETGEPFAPAFDIAVEIVPEAAPVSVEVTAVGEALFPDTLGQFDLGASSQLVLFVFLTAMAGSSALILTRQLGISRRMVSTPTSIGSIVLGEGLGRFGTALTQGLYIMILTLVIFSVNWGDPIGATLILLVLSAVGAGAGMLLGAIFSNDQQAGGVAVVFSLGLAALGGAMFPSELFSPTMQKVAHITPHAWALDGYAELVRRGGTTLDILPELGVLLLYAVVLFALAAWRLRVAITRP